MRRVTVAARMIVGIFDAFHHPLCEYPSWAKRALEARDWHASLRISRDRLGLYSRFIVEHGDGVRELSLMLSDDFGA